MNSHDPPIQAIEAHIVPTCLFHGLFQCRGIGKCRQRVGQIIVFFGSLSKKRTKQWRELIKVQMKQRAKDFAGWVADLQADDATTRAYNAQHFAEALFNISEVAYCEGRAVAIDAVVWEIDMLCIAHAQFDAIL